MSKLLIKNVTALTMDFEERIIESAVVVVEGNKIIDIGTGNLEKKYEGYNVVDGNNGILMPGMVNTHTHAAMTAFRSLADDHPDRLKRYIFPLEKKLVKEDLVYWSTKYAICEMLLSGVTTFCDMYYFEDEVAKACRELGARGVLGETIVNFPSPDASEPYGGLDYSKAFIEKWKKDELITPAVAPHAPYTNDDIHLKRAHELAEHYGVPLIMHVAEMDFEFKKYMEEYNKTPVQYLEDLGILSSNFIGAHFVLVDENDIDILENRNVGVCHNIGANAKGAKGVAPVLEMWKRGMKVGLGTDGPMSGNTLDIITQMSLVGKIQKLFNKDRTIFPAKDIVKMATVGGARVLNIDKKIGSIEIGKKADLVIIETESVNMQPIYDYYSVLVYSANQSNIDTVIVNGEVLVRNKKLLKADFSKTKRRFVEIADEVRIRSREM